MDWTERYASHVVLKLYTSHCLLPRYLIIYGRQGDDSCNYTFFYDPLADHEHS